MVIVSSAPAGEFTIPEEDFYTFRLTEVSEPEVRDNPYYEPDGKHKNKPHMANRTTIRLIWTIEDPQNDFHGEEVWQYYTLSLGTAEYPSNLRPFVAALTGAPVVDPMDLDLDELLDRKIRATLRHEVKKSGGKKAVIEAPMAIKGRSTRVATTPQQTFDDASYDPTNVPY